MKNYYTIASENFTQSDNKELVRLENPNTTLEEIVDVAGKLVPGQKLALHSLITITKAKAATAALHAGTFLVFHPDTASRTVVESTIMLNPKVFLVLLASTHETTTIAIAKVFPAEAYLVLQPTFDKEKASATVASLPAGTTVVLHPRTPEPTAIAIAASMPRGTTLKLHPKTDEPTAIAVAKALRPGTTLDTQRDIDSNIYAAAVTALNPAVKYHLPKQSSNYYISSSLNILLSLRAQIPPVSVTDTPVTNTKENTESTDPRDSALWRLRKQKRNVEDITSSDESVEKKQRSEYSMPTMS